MNQREGYLKTNSRGDCLTNCNVVQLPYDLFLKSKNYVI